LPYGKPGLTIYSHYLYVHTVCRYLCCYKLTMRVYCTVKNFGGEKTLANLVNHNNSPTFFANFPVLQYGVHAET